MVDNSPNLISSISYFDALQLHFKLGSDPSLIFHCNHVTTIADQIMLQLPSNIYVNRNLVLIGAFLHDIGRTKTQGIKHGITGSKIILSEFRQTQFTSIIAKIAARHIGGGIPKEETKDLDLPYEDYLPISLEEKIVCYSDKLADYEFENRNGNYIIKKWFTYNSVTNEINKLALKLGPDHPAISRLKKLEIELVSLNNDRNFNFIINENNKVSFR